MFTSVLGLFLLLAPHHSFAAEYDNNKQVTVKGTVQKVMWVNPHAYVYIDVTDESGKVTTWAFNRSVRTHWHAKAGRAIR